MQKELIIAKYGNVSYLASGHEMGFQTLSTLTAVLSRGYSLKTLKAYSCNY